MTNIKKLFASPKKAVLTIACIVALLAVIGTGTAFAARTIAESSAIGEDKARNFAFADAGIDPVSAQTVRSEFDFEQGQFVYEVEFTADGTEYEYLIKASDGSVVKKQMEIITQDGNHATVTAKLTLDAAKETALQDAGVSASDVTYTKEMLDLDDGISVYELAFYTATHEYEYEINANTGAVYSKSREALVKAPASSASTPAPQHTSSAGSQTSQPGGAQKISLDTAKSKALADAGVSASAATFTKERLEYDDGTAVYELAFYTATHQYEYEIDAMTGAIRDRDADALRGANTSSSAAHIGIDRAKAIAVKHAGLTASEVSFSKAKLEKEDGRFVYEIEFYKNGIEYEYTIDASSGTILEYDSERDD